MMFQSFAPEIRHIILDLVYENIRAQRPTAQDLILAGSLRPKNIPYFPATVCREWRDFAQERSFRQLILPSSCLDDFERIFQDESKRRLVEHVWLHVELFPYGCGPSSSCLSHEHPRHGRKNNEIFADAITNLLRILSTWEPVGNQRKGITLELSAYSPSDSGHCLQDHSFDAVSYSESDFPVDSSPPGPLDPHRRFLARKSTKNRFIDGDHFWSDGKWAPPEGLNRADVLARAMGIPLRFPLDPELVLPQVGVVTRFLMRRQFYRTIHFDSQAKIISSLPNLEEFNFEFWYRVANFTHPKYLPGTWAPHTKATYILNYRRHALRDPLDVLEKPFKIPQTAKTMTIYEAENVAFTGDFKWPRPCHASASHLFHGVWLALQSQHLEHLSVSFAVDALEFFVFWLPTDRFIYKAFTLTCKRHEPLFPVVMGKLVAPAPWENLETLALTSRVFHPRNPASNAEDIISAAGGAALQMPKLKTMEIWYAHDDGYAAVFRYERKAPGRPVSEVSYAAASWWCSWGMGLEEDGRVKKIWQKVALKHGRRGGLIFDPLRGDVNLSRISVGSVLAGELKLRGRIVHPLSLYQIRSEAEDAGIVREDGGSAQLDMVHDKSRGVVGEKWLRVVDESSD
ncbi:hypothetical protein B0T19DRAFT_125100 [Cercophora scortea]|uniref:DUF6546 domain-containing protein n=1 Tax=Cercophora scortea TaxID=314031 RepID=A0AAE0IYS7_9PEZI|nr:hypothetical protein B0T19DRAFT_125100 [Cercophora scortea]